jgi:class II aldolase/adducin N-terminal domain-containing protein
VMTGETIAAASPITAALTRSATGSAEWQTRLDLAALYRLVALEGWDDLIFTHISARVPGPEHHFLINPFGLFFEEITASSLVKIDLDGRVIGQSHIPVNAAGFNIHSAIHGARDDAKFVLHLHSDAGVAVAAQAEGLLPLTRDEEPAGAAKSWNFICRTKRCRGLARYLLPRTCLLPTGHGAVGWPFRSAVGTGCGAKHLPRPGHKPVSSLRGNGHGRVCCACLTGVHQAMTRDVALSLAPCGFFCPRSQRQSLAWS